MIIGYSNDGNIYNPEELEPLEIKINKQRDLLYYIDKDCNRAANFNFVGFTSDKDDNLYIVFPKGYMAGNIEEDAKILFSVIQKYKNSHPDLYTGSIYGDNYSSNFPFAAFWEIYEYYKHYGLYHEITENIKQDFGNKINWKVTLKKTKFYSIGNDIMFFPFFYSKKQSLSNFVTDCMIFAIDYTISKFFCLLDLQPTCKKCPEFDFIKNKDYIINILNEIKNKNFKDNIRQLLNNLINFFEQLNQGGNYYFKSYSFEYIWEDMVSRYLSLKFNGIKDGELLLNNTSEKSLYFKKECFHPNLANIAHSIQPDMYCIHDDCQYIFDAKYKKEIKGIDYKQLCYSVILKDRKNSITKERLCNKTYSALLVPDTSTHSNLHFKIDPIFSDSMEDINIIEQYLDIKMIMKWYVNR